MIITLFVKTKDIPKWKRPFFFIFKGLSHTQLLFFFVSYALTAHIVML